MSVALSQAPNSEVDPWRPHMRIGSSCNDNSCTKHEEKNRNKKQAQESCGNGGAVESVKSQKQASPSFHSPLEISPNPCEIPTFPQPRRLRRGKVENQKQVSHFPTAISYVRKTNGKRAGFAPALRGGASLRLSQRRLPFGNIIW
jgi:hypothetical protein